MSRAAVVPWKRGTAEFFIIFAGITLSLVADDWRQARGEKGREGVLLSALEEELLADSVDLAEVLSSRARTESLSISLLKSLHSPERPSEAAAVVSNLLFGRIPQPVNATYVGIINGGELSLIRDDHLRGLIVDYYEVQQPYIAEFWLWYKGFYLDWIDAVKRHYEFSLLDSAATLFPPPPLREKTDWPTVRGDSEFRGNLEWLGLNSANQVLRIPDVIQKNVMLRQEITGYLKER